MPELSPCRLQRGELAQRGLEIKLPSARGEGEKSRLAHRRSEVISLRHVRARRRQQLRLGACSATRMAKACICSSCANTSGRSSCRKPAVIATLNRPTRRRHTRTRPRVFVRWPIGTAKAVCSRWAAAPCQESRAYDEVCAGRRIWAVRAHGARLGVHCRQRASLLVPAASARGEVRAEQRRATGQHVRGARRAEERRGSLCPGQRTGTDGPEPGQSAILAARVRGSPAVRRPWVAVHGGLPPADKTSGGKGADGT